MTQDYQKIFRLNLTSANYSVIFASNSYSATF